MAMYYYTDIADELEADIRKGIYPLGSKLPTHQELGVRFGVGYTTVAKAVALLRDRGLVESRPPLGVFVVDRL